MFWSGVWLYPKFLSYLAPQILSLTLYFPQTIIGSGSFEIHLVSLKNIEGEKLDGGCCDGSRTIYRGQSVCLDECDTFFKACLKQYTSYVSSVSGPCTFGESTTAVLGGSSITFTNTSSSNNGFRNPISIRFTFSWLVSYHGLCSETSS